MAQGFGGFGFRITRVGSWQEARKRFGRAAKEYRKRQFLAIKRAALLLEANLKKGIASGAPGNKKFKPLAASTILLRRAHSSSPLLDRGDLLGSIHTTTDEKKGTAFVGVHRTSGNTLVNVAAIHEYGTKPFAIQVTDGIRRLFVHLYLASGGAILPLSKKTTVIHHPGVPARPFFRPTLEASRQNISREIRAELERDGGPI